MSSWLPRARLRSRWCCQSAGAVCSTSVTECVYRKELRPVITRGARAMNQLFDGDAKR